MFNKTPEQLLVEGQKLREAGETLLAIDKITRAMDGFAKIQDYPRFAHCLVDRGICYQHLYQLNDNHFGFAVLYKKEAEALLEIVLEKKIDEETSLAFFMNAKAQGLFSNYAQAAKLFEQAAATISPERQAQKGDFLTNLGKAQYLSGQKELGVKTILDGIEMVKQHRAEVDLYTANVWISGGYLRLAEILQSDQPAESAKYLREATNIIDSDQTQVMRKKQLEVFLATKHTGL